jgi:hypothetical protein
VAAINGFLLEMRAKHCQGTSNMPNRNPGTAKPREAHETE